MKLKPFVLMLSATAAGLLSACTPADSVGNAAAKIAEAKASARDWPTFSHAFLENYFKLNPSFAVYQGRHEFDGQLPDWSNKGLQAQRDFLKQAIAEAKAFDQAKMTKEQKFERAYLIARSEEHTSELQSLMRISYAVFCLKKKTQQST